MCIRDSPVSDRGAVPPGKVADDYAIFPGGTEPRSDTGLSLIHISGSSFFLYFSKSED